MEPSRLVNGWLANSLKLYVLAQHLSLIGKQLICRASLTHILASCPLAVHAGFRRLGSLRCRRVPAASRPLVTAGSQAVGLRPARAGNLQRAHELGATMPRYYFDLRYDGDPGRTTRMGSNSPALRRPAAKPSLSWLRS